MNRSENLKDIIIIDGLNISNWGASTFEAMHRAGITAANCTCSVWEGFTETMKAMAQWKLWFEEFKTMIMPIYTTKDIFQAQKEKKVGIILGWQNTTGFGDHLPYVRIFREIGLRIVQLTYNTANSVGSGCYESTDGGLTDFGRELVHELNHQGILIDLSHVGQKTARDTILYSKKPVTYSHCCPFSLRKHPRNKTDEDLKLIAEHGGVIGITMFPPFLKNGNEATIDDYIDTIEYVINLVGEDHVAIGTDFTQGHDKDFFNYITHDKGEFRKLVEFGEISFPKGIQRIEDIPNLFRTMEKRKWSEPKIRKVMGENWIRLYKDVWNE